LYCWGKNKMSSVNHILPSPISEDYVVNVNTLVSDVEHVAVYGNATCISRSSDLRCWGENSHGVLGIPTTTPWVNYDTAMAAPPLLSGNVRGIFMSRSRACALVDLDLMCWGDNNDESLQLGAGFISTPVVVASDVEQAVVTEWGVCFAGTGPLQCHVAPFPGNATALDLEDAVYSRNLESIHDLSADPLMPLLCATDTSGNLYCGGANGFGVLGAYGLSSTILDFEPVTTGTDTLKFSMSSGHACTDQGGAIQCTGVDSDGQLGNGPEDFNPKSTFVGAEY